MNIYIGLELGGKNVKIAVAERINKKVNFILADQLSVSTLHESAYDVNLLLQRKVGVEKLKYTEAVLVSSSATVAYGSLLDGLREVDMMVKGLIKDFSRDLSVLFISRDGKFHDIKTIDSEIQENPRAIYKYIDAYWYAPAKMAGKIFKIKDFVYVDMGSSSMSIIPMVNEIPVIDPLENRLISGKLIPIGVRYTPLIYLSNEVNLKGRRFKAFPYIRAFTSDMLAVRDNADERIKRRALWALARTIAEDVSFVEEDTLEELACFFYRCMKKIIEDGVRDIVSNFFTDRNVPLVVTGTGSNLLHEVLQNDYQCYHMNMENTHGSLGLLYYFLEDICKYNIEEGFECVKQSAK